MKSKSDVKVLTPAAARQSKLMRSAKWRGEVVEMAFQHKVTQMGFIATKPYSDNQSYDFIVDAGNRLWRVQVKSTTRAVDNGFRVNAAHFRWGGKTKWAYTPEQIDILAAYIVPADVWYLVPVRAFTPSIQLTFFPRAKGYKGFYEQFREAWFLLACRQNGEPRDGIVTSPACSYSASSRSPCPGCPYKKKHV
jgi:hypothetical protein